MVIQSLVFGSENNFTDWFYGVQFRFDNYWSELPQTNSFATLDTIEFYNSENEYDEDLEAAFSPIRYAEWGGFEIPSGDVTLEFWNEGFSNRAMFDYKIEFSPTQNLDTDGNTVILNTQFPVRMRAAPSALEQSGTASDYKVRRSTTQTCSSVPTFGHATVDQVSTQFTKSSHGWGDGSAVRCGSGATDAYLGWSAEF